MNPNEPQNTELDALTQLSYDANEKLASIDVSGEAQVIKQQETVDAVRDLEAPLEAGVIATTQLKDPLLRIAENTARPAEATFNIGTRVDADDVEFNENLAGKALWQMLRGPKGAKGDKGDTGEPGKDSTKAGPRGPKGDKGDKGEPGEPGRDGRDGKDGRDGLDGRDGVDGRDGIDGKDGRTPEKGTDYLTDEDVAQLAEQAAKKVDPDLQAMRRHVASKTYALAQLEDVFPEGANNNAVLQFNASTSRWFAGVAITVSATAPTDPKEGDLWIDTTP
jgi:hypothetical protein